MKFITHRIGMVLVGLYVMVAGIISPTHIVTVLKETVHDMEKKV